MVKVLFQKALEKGYCGLLNRMRSTGDIQFFVGRPRIIPEPPFPSLAGSGNEIGFVYEFHQFNHRRPKRALHCNNYCIFDIEKNISLKYILK